MEKTIKIGNKQFNMSSSAYTQFKYKNETGRSLIADLLRMEEKYKTLYNKDETTIEQLEALQEIADDSLKIAFIMINENDKNQAPNYEEFLKSLDDYLIDVSWIEEVSDLASAPLSRGVQANEEQKQEQ